MSPVEFTQGETDVLTVIRLNTTLEYTTNRLRLNIKTFRNKFTVNEIHFDVDNKTNPRSNTRKFVTFYASIMRVLCFTK